MNVRRFNGECECGIGSFVMINDQGDFITAYHIITHITSILSEYDKYNNLVQLRSDIEQDATLKPGERTRKLNSNKIPPHAITNFSIWWGGVGGFTNFEIGQGIPEVDLAVGKLPDYNNPNPITYPLFKDHTRAMDPGTSLCKLGFPLYEIKPEFQNGNFILPEGAIPAPFFPLDGILTRFIKVENSNNYPFELKLIETSTPGLLGQSGGPTIDIHGSIWAIQSMTSHYPLGFGQNQKGSEKQTMHLKNQYLHAGIGIHVETITGFLTQSNIPFNLSPN